MGSRSGRENTSTPDSADGRFLELQQPQSRRVDGSDPARPVERNHAGRHAIQDGFDVAPPALAFFVFLFEIERRPLEPPPTGSQLGRHRIERLDHRTEFVGALVLDPMVVVPGADLTGRFREHLDGPRDALGQIEPHPGRADQDEQRDHDEERDIDARQRLLQHAKLRVVLVGSRHAAGPIGQIARRGTRLRRPRR